MSRKYDCPLEAQLVFGTYTIIPCAKGLKLHRCPCPIILGAGLFGPFTLSALGRAEKTRLEPFPVRLGPVSVRVKTRFG